MEICSTCPQKVEKTTLKSCSEKLKSTFFLTASTAQMALTEEFMFQNVAYRPTVYRTGIHISLMFEALRRHVEGANLKLSLNELVKL